MTRATAPVAILALAAALLPRAAPACTTFCLDRNGQVVFGKNYDFGIGYGMLVVNKRGVSYSSLRGAGRGSG